MWRSSCLPCCSSIRKFRGIPYELNEVPSQDPPQNDLLVVQQPQPTPPPSPFSVQQASNPASAPAPTPSNEATEHDSHSDSDETTQSLTAIEASIEQLLGNNEGDEEHEDDIIAKRQPVPLNLNSIEIPSNNLFGASSTASKHLSCQLSPPSPAPSIPLPRLPSPKRKGDKTGDNGQFSRFG